MQLGNAIEVDFENEDETGASMSWEWFLNLKNGDLKSKTAGRFQNSKTNEWEREEDAVQTCEFVKLEVKQLIYLNNALGGLNTFFW